jgi:hypothetical protein
MKPESAETVKQIADGVAVVTAVGSLINVLPAVAALFTIIWTGMRIAEMVTGKEFSVLIGMKKVAKDAEQQQETT